MGCEPPALNGAPVVALIGHQESWASISRIVHALRAPDRPPIALDDVRSIVPWIPPRRLLRMAFRSEPSGLTIPGIYVDAFITPDELASGAFRAAIAKVRDAIRCAAREGARVAALGGFTSIVIEGATDDAVEADWPALTTGNTLTAALIVKGFERAALAGPVPLAEMTVVVAGATGDIGSACARYFGRKVRRVLLSARRPDRLEHLANELRDAGVDAVVRSVDDALREADGVISVASLAQPEWDPACCRPGALICDAGYPKNLRVAPGPTTARLFHGGMGHIRGGWVSDSPLVDCFYSFPARFVVHGCMLEAVVLAFEARYEPFSRGRGHITPDRIEQMWGMARRHGIGLAPFFNHDGLWADQPAGDDLA